jgi:hypothetical protein
VAAIRAVIRSVNRRGSVCSLRLNVRLNESIKTTLWHTTFNVLFKEKEDQF